MQDQDRNVNAFGEARRSYLAVLDDMEREDDIVADLRERLTLESQRALDLERERDTYKALCEILVEVIDNA